eukprot:206367-Chlamydomonas_euryale.AAC.1
MGVDVWVSAGGEAIVPKVAIFTPLPTPAHPAPLMANFPLPKKTTRQHNPPPQRAVAAPAEALAAPAAGRRWRGDPTLHTCGMSCQSAPWWHAMCTRPATRRTVTRPVSRQPSCSLSSDSMSIKCCTCQQPSNSSGRSVTMRMAACGLMR